jgi:activator of 2-hydroxyglutaryl-CoA dehydratase
MQGGAPPLSRCPNVVGAEKARVIKCDRNRTVIDFAMNEKCAAESRAFVEAMARALGPGVEEIRPLSS